MTVELTRKQIRAVKTALIRVRADRAVTNEHVTVFREVCDRLARQFPNIPWYLDGEE